MARAVSVSFSLEFGLLFGSSCLFSSNVDTCAEFREHFRETRVVFSWKYACLRSEMSGFWHTVRIVMCLGNARAL